MQLCVPAYTCATVQCVHIHNTGQLHALACRHLLYRSQLICNEANLPSVIISILKLLVHRNEKLYSQLTIMYSWGKITLLKLSSKFK